MNKKRDVIIAAVFGIIFLLGLSVMLYPTFANWWNKQKVSHTISAYKEDVAKLDESEKNRLLEEARVYNEQLAELNAPFKDFNTIPGYEDILNISDTGIMGYVRNPDNWCPIEQDYYVDGRQFCTIQPRPYRVCLGTGTFSRDLGKALGIEGVYGREIPGGAAQMLCMPLNKNKKLKSLTVKVLSNDVVIGLMGVTLQLPASPRVKR